jgi:GT2 family glycosyltransferase
MEHNQGSSVSASIVLYKTSLKAIAPLVEDLAQAGVARSYVIDNSPEDFKKDDIPLPDNVVLVRTGRNLGYGKAHNIGIRDSVETYRYHLICNPDIKIARDTISTLTHYMDSNPTVGLCMPKLLTPAGEMQYCCRRSPVLLDYVSQVIAPASWGRAHKDALEMRSFDYESAMEPQCLSGCFMFFRTDILASLGGFDERFFLYFEDFDLSMRSRSLARNVYLPATYVIHERQSAHLRSWRLKFAFMRSAIQYFAKWGWFSASRRSMTQV